MCRLSIALGRWVLLCALAMGGRSNALAQTPLDTGSIALTVSGGVSLGSYQAGATWAFVFALRARDSLATLRTNQYHAVGETMKPGPLPKLEVLTGASAGNINAVLAAIDYCRATPQTSPHQSMFWRAWTEIGFAELVKGGIDSANLSVFSRSAFDPLWVELGKDLDQAASVPNCDLTLGITTTKLVPQVVRLETGVEAPAQSFSAVFRLVSDKGLLKFAQPNPTDVLSNALFDVLILHPDTTAGSVPRRLDNNNVALSLTQIREIAEASSAFPAAFAPRQLSFQTLDSLGWKLGSSENPPCLLLAHVDERCKTPRVERFVDGGIINNRPIGLALRLGQTRENADPRTYNSKKAIALRDTAIKALDRACRRFFSTEGSSFAASLDTLYSAENVLEGIRLGTALDSSLTDSAVLIERERAATLRIRENLKEAAGRAFAASRSAAGGEGCRNASVRLSQLNDSLVRMDQARKPATILYFIDDDARRGVADEQDRVVESRGGLATAVGVMLSAFHTGQDREIRVLEKELKAADAGQSSAVLRVSTRNPRLMGEHIGHFGAFLARSFREHDFYAGVYDGLRSAFRELYCRSFIADSTTATKSVKSLSVVEGTACEVRWLRLAIESEVIRLTPTGRALIERFLAHEVTSLDSPLPEPTIDSTYHLVSLIDANVSARRQNARQCKTSAVAIESPLCADRMLSVIQDWKERLAVSGGVGRRSLCTGPQKDRDACAMIIDPEATYHRMALDAFSRLRKAEATLDKAKQPGFPGPVGLLLYFERAYNEQYRSRWAKVRTDSLSSFDLNPTSSDVMGKPRAYTIGARFLPNSVGTKPAYDDTWLEWRPTFYAFRYRRASVAFVAPVEWVFAERERELGVGVGVMVIPPWTPISSITASRIARPGEVPAIDLTVAAFGGLLRVGLRSGAQTVGRFISPNNITIGMGDVNGVVSRFLVWWAGHFD